jgi:predicted DCC family thiol-disulfide oxidoreductase YuxK
MPLLPIAGVVGPLVPGFLRDAVYDLVANNRYELLGMKDECRLSDDRFDDRFVGE